MRTIIIEDENLAARRLESLIHNYDLTIQVEAKLESIEDSVDWLSNNRHPDLIFLDIHLEDGLSFSIFDKVKVDVPIIFTTAFDEYAIKAFKLKSIDYLLKPIVQEDLNKAIEKYKNWSEVKMQLVDMHELVNMIQERRTTYRDRFSVAVRDKLKTIEVKDIAYFFSTSGITFAVMQSNNQYSLDISLDSLLGELDPKQFYRINRQYIVQLGAINNVHVYPKSRLKIDLLPPVKEDIFISLDRVTDFKKWFDGGK